MVEYKKGSENVVADALPRKGEVTVTEVITARRSFKVLLL